MRQLIKALAQVNLLSFKGLLLLICALYHNGVNLMALLSLSAIRYPERLAVCDEQEQVTYKELYQQARQIACGLQQDYGIHSQQKIAIICCNHASLLRSLFACSILGVDIYLLSADMSQHQFNELVDDYQFDFIVYDPDFENMVSSRYHSDNSLPITHPTQRGVLSYSDLEQKNTQQKIKKSFRSGRLIVLTGGTTGKAKAAARKPSLTQFLNPFLAFMTQLQLGQYRSIFIATPVYHGFGLASVCVAILLGARIYFMKKFDAVRANQLIEQHQIEVISFVPLMLSRMLNEPGKLSTLQCMVTGGAYLPPPLVKQATNTLTAKLFNLYGTSEAGVCTIATPADLNEHADTIGKPIAGLALSIRNKHNQIVPTGKTGRLCVQCHWQAEGTDAWVETGDLGYRDEQGYFYINGRVDDMIVSGGVNVYPVSLENALLEHEAIQEACVLGVDDQEFGQRLKAFIVLHNQTAQMDTELLFIWLKKRLASYQIPKKIVILAQIPLTPVGKPDKRALAHLENVQQ